MVDRATEQLFYTRRIYSKVHIGLATPKKFSYPQLSGQIAGTVNPKAGGSISHLPQAHWTCPKNVLLTHFDTKSCMLSSAAV